MCVRERTVGRHGGRAQLGICSALCFNHGHSCGPQALERKSDLNDDVWALLLSCTETPP